MEPVEQGKFRRRKKRYPSPGARKLGIGEFDGWAYVAALSYNPTYVVFLLEDVGAAEIPEKKKKFDEWEQYNNVTIVADGKTGAAGRQGILKNSHTIGASFGYLVIPTAVSRVNHFGECYRRLGNLYLGL